MEKKILIKKGQEPKVKCVEIQTENGKTIVFLNKKLSDKYLTYNDFESYFHSSEFNMFKRVLKLEDANEEVLRFFAHKHYIDPEKVDIAYNNILKIWGTENKFNEKSRNFIKSLYHNYFVLFNSNKTMKEMDDLIKNNYTQKEDFICCLTGDLIKTPKYKEELHEMILYKNKPSKYGFILTSNEKAKGVSSEGLFVLQKLINEIHVDYISHAHIIDPKTEYSVFYDLLNTVVSINKKIYIGENKSKSDEKPKIKPVGKIKLSDEKPKIKPVGKIKLSDEKPKIKPVGKIKLSEVQKSIPLTEEKSKGTFADLLDNNTLSKLKKEVKNN